MVAIRLICNFLFMKKFFAAVAVAVFIPVTVFAAYTPGTYTARINSNIRSMPSMNGLLIGHYLTGNTVNVLQVVGSWCRVAYKYYNSYVYCSLLVPTGSVSSPTAAQTGSTVTAVVTNGLVTQNLKATQNWLLTNNEGVDYINNSYFKAKETSLTWDGGSKLSDFYFQWPLPADSKCTLTFSGPSHLQEIFNAGCFDNAGAQKTWTKTVDNPLEGYNLPVLPYKMFVANLLADKTLMASFDNYFAKSTSIKGLFRLYKGANGVLLWEGKFIDEDSGYFMIVNTDASKTSSTFNVQQGMFQ